MALPLPLPILTPEEQVLFVHMLCPANEPLFTPDRVNPTRTFERRVFRPFPLALPFPAPNTGSTELEMWVIADEANDAETFPSAAIRVVEGEIVHTITQTREGPHTIHHHGIEPTPANDGVGANSFEIDNTYAYQWLASEPGTYFYHCHKNTPLHFIRGMWGPLIIDPQRGSITTVPAPPYPAGGPGLVKGFNAPSHLIRYDREAAWITSEHDSRWHELDHDAAMAGCSPTGPFTNLANADNILHDFRPDVFTLSGVVWPSDNSTLTNPAVSVNASVGQTILIRLVCAGYNIHRYTLGLNAQVIAMDGRALGVPPRQNYSSPFTIPAGRPFMLTSAMRYDLIIRPTTTGTFECKVDYLHWITRRRLFTGKMLITVT